MSDGKLDGEDFQPIRLEDLGLAVPTSLEQEAIQMHEIFNALSSAGFTEYQALRLTAMILTDDQSSQGYSVQMNDDQMFGPDDDDIDDQDIDLED